MSKVFAWSNQIIKDIESRKDYIYKKDYAFFKIDRLTRMAQRIDQFSDNCETCLHLKSEIESLAEIYPDAINGSANDKFNFEKRNEAIVKHLKYKHALVQKDYYMALFSFIGFFIGTLFFGLTAFLFAKEYLTFALLSGFTIGIITGRIYGKKKDQLKTKQNQIL